MCPHVTQTVTEGIRDPKATLQKRTHTHTYTHRKERERELWHGEKTSCLVKKVFLHGYLEMCWVFNISSEHPETYPGLEQEGWGRTGCLVRLA